MPDLAIAVVFAVFIWWFSTGIVLLLNRMSGTAIRASLLVSSLLALAALAGLVQSAERATVGGAYCAFTCALIVWGWHELSFLTGWITGPRKTALAADARGWHRFVESVRAILWHEIGILVGGVLIIAMSWNAPNQVGTGTFLVLWLMRTSAKLNLFFGVRNLSEEFLPSHLVYMKSFFRRRAFNWFFPFSIAGAGFVLVWLIFSATDAPEPAQGVGLALVGTMLALAILEHGLLVLPIDTTALWRWAIRRQVIHTAGEVSPVPAVVPGRTTDSITTHDKYVQIR